METLNYLSEVGQVYNVILLNGNKVECKMLAMNFESCKAPLAKYKDIHRLIQTVDSIDP